MRKSLIFLTGLLIVSALMFSCTIAGAELGLIGTWELTKYESFGTEVTPTPDYTLTIKCDDTFVEDNDGTENTGTITADMFLKTLTNTYDDTNISTTSTYVVNCNTLEINYLLLVYTYTKKQ